ncbi:hypothetical protein SPAB_05476 [Salmonella enterica subsp. enterica serovar Paratyphi B str. SPB7]|uniref:Uncharacterized protein n=1 Tax=Salmonella paratyphi B (strain ATCC BAA-1250 / SPB7) TaxID=1016998 RepID=A0A6C6Z9H1_SALPB|nr:hypothetical protein SPAB_05476 [Salmonella enterica subsp. enterica serovar Paratyphi B str. SPB7]
MPQHKAGTLMPFRYQSCVDFFIADLCKKEGGVNR